MPQLAVPLWGTALGVDVTAISCDGDSVALGFADGSVELWACTEAKAGGERLGRACAEEHMREGVSGVTLRAGILVGCCLDAYIWQESAFSATPVPLDSYGLVDVQHIAELQGHRALAASISHDGAHIAVSYDRWVVVASPDGACTALLEGHTAEVQVLHFSEVLPGTLVTAGFDRTFKVWDHAGGVMLYQSGVLSAYPALSLAEQHAPHRLALGFADGVVRIVSVEEGYKVLRQVDLPKQAKRWKEKAAAAEPPAAGLRRVTSRPPWQRGGRGGGGGAGGAEAESGELGHCPLAMQCVGDAWFLVCTNHAVLAISCSSFDASVCLGGDPCMPFTTAAWAYPLLAISSGFAAKMRVFNLLLDTDAAAAHRDAATPPPPAHPPATQQHPEDGAASVFLRHPLPRALSAPLVVGNTSGSSAAPPSSRERQGGGKEPRMRAARPVVFQKGSVRSSGYASSEPWSVQQQRKKAAQQRKAAKAAKAAPSVCGPAPRYTRGVGAPCVVQAQHSAPFASRPLHSGAVMDIAFASDSKHLATASADRLGCFVKLPVARFSGEAKAFKAHTAPLTCTAVTHAHGGEQAVLTGSLDATALLWRPTRDTPFLRLEKPAEVRGCAFMQLDRLAVVATGGSIDFHMYALDGEVDDLDRFTNRSVEKQVLSVATGNQAVTCVACHNTFASGLVFFGGSNRSISAYDISAQRCAVSIEDGHERPVQRIAVPDASAFAGVPPSALEVFATSAPDGVVRLWDVRCPKAATRSFASHMNRVHAVGAAFSPCMSFLATGSEDRCTYVYDLGSGKVVEKVHTHTDVVSCVAFSPVFPQLAAAGHDGKVVFLADK